MSDLASAVRAALSEPLHVAQVLGLTDGMVREGRRVSVRCPAHGERTASCSLSVGPDGTLRVKCFGCNLAGNVYFLIAAVEGLDVRRDFRAVLARAAQLAGLTAEDAGRRSERPRAPGPPPVPYPPSAEVRALWNACGPVEFDAEAAAWAARRALPVRALRGLARVIRRGLVLPPWAGKRHGVTRELEPWTVTGHRVLVPVYDATGRCRSVRAIRIGDGDTPKRLPPGGFRASELLLANALGRGLLAQTNAGGPLVIVEGEPDFLSAAARAGAPAIWGFLSGCWSAAFASRVPSGARVVVWTHNDAARVVHGVSQPGAGHRYAETIAASLRDRCDVRRGRLPEGVDLNDLLRKGAFPDLLAGDAFGGG
jgi:hypothetical protein